MIAFQKLHVFGFSAIAAVILTVGVPTFVQAEVVTFDDLTVDRSLVPDGYGGINWGGHFILFTDHYGLYVPESNYNSVYTPFLSNAPLVAEYLFSFVTPGEVFDGAWFSGYTAPFGPSEFIHFDLFYHSQRVHTSASLTPLQLGPQFLASGYSGPVDAVGVYATFNGYYVMDNVTYHSAPVPEPSSFALLGLGGLGLAFGACRRRQAPV